MRSQPPWRYWLLSFVSRATHSQLEHWNSGVGSRGLDGVTGLRSCKYWYLCFLKCWFTLLVGGDFTSSSLRRCVYIAAMVFGPMAALSDQVRPSDSATPHALFAHGSLARPGPTLQMCDPFIHFGPMAALSTLRFCCPSHTFGPMATLHDQFNPLVFATIAPTHDSVNP